MPGPLTFSRRAQKLMYLLLVTLADNVFVPNEDIKKLIWTWYISEVEVAYYDISGKMFLVLL